MKQILIIIAIILISTIPVTEANVTKVAIHGVVFDSSSSTYNTTLQWDAQNFTGFWYNPGSHKSSETLTIVNQGASSLTASSREIQKENLQYKTSRTDQKYKVFSYNNNLKVENGLTNSLTKTTSGGYYARLGWFGDLYVAVNGKANKLAKLIKEQATQDKQTLKPGASWGLGEGYNLTVDGLDTEVSPRLASLSFSKDGQILDKKVVKQGEVYTYVVKSLNGESDVPVFVTYVEGIFTGAEDKSALVQLRYTWLISQNVLDIKQGDLFGIFEVKEANENYVLLHNKDKTINLAQNSVQTLYGDMKFKVADKATELRFYPIFEKTIQDTPKVDLKTVTANATNATNTSVESTDPTITLASVSTTPATSSQPASPPGAVQASSPVTTPTTSGDTAKPQQWDWIIFAAAGLVGTGYLVLRR